MNGDSRRKPELGRELGSSQQAIYLAGGI